MPLCYSVNKGSNISFTQVNVNLQKFTLEALPEYTPKLTLAKILEVSSRTLYEYHNTAMLISDFEAEYPAFTNDSYPITKAKLTKYQCWVLFSLILVCRRLPREKVHICLLQDLNPDFSQKFTKQYFQKYQQELNHESEAICRTA